VIVGFVEHDGSAVDPLSLQMLTLGRGLAKELGLPLHAVLIGDEARPLAGDLSAYGVSLVHLVHHERLDDYAPRAWAKSLADLIRALSPRIVLASGGERSTEVMAYVGAMLGLPLAANCTVVRPGEPFLLTRFRWGGSLLEETHLDAAVKLLTVAPHAVMAEEVPEAEEAVVEEVIPALDDDDLRVRVSGRVGAGSDRVLLPEARVVVGGGRGVGSAQGFGILEELAGLLGGTVGVSRVVTSAGWRPHSDQIGQTGTRIAPDIYIACGISGAIQHMVGCKGAKRILAINSDPDAPMVTKADYAVIGDLHEIIPALIGEIRKTMG
jgi:electron transfer flavoprotein alpha subunit